jgi:hypothetical protein
MFRARRYQGGNAMKQQDDQRQEPVRRDDEDPADQGIQGSRDVPAEERTRAQGPDDDGDELVGSQR